MTDDATRGCVPTTTTNPRIPRTATAHHSGRARGQPPSKEPSHAADRPVQQR
nr:MAG TPA: hypothetical protein [Caudoviricetes sp.]